ncbi:patatin [Microvirga tunisiensis]|uniref:Patatin n=2 Tax=Pannonibacter tanglangensis TaxID=2750084 RepID=A0ABW9ZIN4_9HYPH|nr:MULTISPECIES: patatin-like phospholipase family protein [unclassified Pannonibacter]NBN64722.1 patatin [Pannonibacter sp. XCT-34]NBN79256.1 patatin [Pannonibacter sp. XCT-53]
MATAKRFILSIDGGGMRGLIPLRVLEALEGRLARLGVELPMHRVFDLMCGSSSGGLIVAGLAAPKATGGHGEAAATVAELRRFFEEEARALFTHSLRKRLSRFVTNPFGVFDERYDGRLLDQLLKDRFGWTSLQSALTHLVVTGYDIEHRRPLLMGTAPADGGARPDDYYIWQAVRAALAAPSFFEPARIDNLSLGRQEAVIDGSVVHADPVLVAYAEARKLGFAPRDIVIVSLGVGRAPDRAINPQAAENWGAHGWMLPSNGAPIWSVLTSAQAQGVADAAALLFTEMDGPSYIRIDGLVPAEAEDWDNARPGNLLLLNGAADRIIRDHTLVLDRLAAVIAAALSAPEADRVAPAAA